MFTWLGKAKVKSSEGYTVGISGWRSYKYHENQGEIDIAVELGMRESRCLVYVFEDAFFKWSDGRNISKQKQLQIQKNFIEALDFMKTDVVID